MGRSISIIMRVCCCTSDFLMLLVGVLVLLYNYYPGNHGGTITRSTSTIWKVGWLLSIPLPDAPTKTPAKCEAGGVKVLSEGVLR